MSQLQHRKPQQIEILKPRELPVHYADVRLAQTPEPPTEQYKRVSVLAIAGSVSLLIGAIALSIAVSAFRKPEPEIRVYQSRPVETPSPPPSNPICERNCFSVF